MDFPIITVLFGFTAGAVMVFAAISRRKTKERMEDPDAPKSTLAKDSPNR